MRPGTALTGFLVFALAACGGEDAGSDAEAMADEADAMASEAGMDETLREIEGGGDLAGWNGRTDGDVPFDDVLVTEMDGGMFQIDVGPAVVLWQDDLVAEGAYTLSGTFHQVSSKDHPHGTGLVFGGADMAGDGQVYTYFMVRGSGDFLVKTRTGDETFWVEPTDGWVPHDAVSQTDANDEFVNELAVQVTDAEVVFMVNGTEVLRRPSEGIYTDGMYGVRANHNLTIQVSNLTVETGQ
jgi:hypothetical protein